MLDVHFYPSCGDLIRLTYLAGSPTIAVVYLLGAITAFAQRGTRVARAPHWCGRCLFALAPLRATLEFYFAVIRMLEDVHRRV